MFPLGAIALFLKSTSQSANGNAFTNVRGTLLSTAEESSDNFSNSSGNPHGEDFLNAFGL